MKNFPVDDDLVALVWGRANPKPFENLSFSEALRRVLTETKPKADSNRKPSPISADELLAELNAMGKEELENLKDYKITRLKRAPSPRPVNWLSKVSDLRTITNLKSWQDICDHLGVEVAGDSARRKLKEWVQKNRPLWPEVPDA
jgi:hypothetical protein